MLHRLSEITAEHEGLVKNHDHKKIFSTLFNFCTVDLSAFYFDIRKDALYCDPLGSTRRRACRTVMNEVFLRLTTWLAPIMCFTMEEVWKARFPDENGSVHLEEFRDVPSEWNNPKMIDWKATLEHFTKDALKVLEEKRREKVIGSSLDAYLQILGTAEDLKAFKTIMEEFGIFKEDSYSNPANPIDTIADLCVVSGVQLVTSNKMTAGQFEYNLYNFSDPKVPNGIRKKCERSWKYFKPTGVGQDITPRDATAVAEYDAN